MDLAGLKKGFASLNPYLISKRKDCTIWRKRGSISAPGSQMNLEDLVDCEVFVCDRTEQAFVDECSGCAVLIGCCSGPTFVRDCKGCTFWVATRQLRTRDCVDCKFFLHSHTEPIIESSKDLAFAPFAASYPGVAEHFREAKMDADRNFWNAIFDFTGKADGANWRILPLGECCELDVRTEESSGGYQCPSAPLSHALLCQAPLRSDEGSGQSLVDLPQTRPALPAHTGASAQRRMIADRAPTEAAAAAAPGPMSNATGKEGKPKLRKPRFIEVNRLNPDSRGVNVFAKVVQVSPVASDLAEVVLGDASARVTFRARGDQVQLCQPGSILRIQNALVVMVKGYIRLEVNKWGVAKPAPDHADFEVAALDISAVEYELAQA